MSSTFQTKSKIDQKSGQILVDDPLAIRSEIAYIDELASLEDDYDSMDGVAPTYNTIDSAKLIIRQAFELCFTEHILWKTPGISLAPDGNIHIEWRTDGNVMSVITNCERKSMFPYKYKCNYLVDNDNPVRVILDTFETAKQITAFLSLN